MVIVVHFLMFAHVQHIKLYDEKTFIYYNFYLKFTVLFGPVQMLNFS